MSNLSENEIFDLMLNDLRAAITAADTLAVSPITGPTYSMLRDALGHIEGCCRQVAYIRQDARWLQLGKAMSEAHKFSGSWLRGYRLHNGRRVRYAPGQRNALFKMLADNLRFLYKLADDHRTKATGSIKPIVPDHPAVHQSGLILPEKYRRVLN